MRFARWITKATHAHSEYVILIAFPRQQSLNEGASMLRDTCIACVVKCENRKRTGEILRGQTHIFWLYSTWYIYIYTASLWKVEKDSWWIYEAEIKFTYQLHSGFSSLWHNNQTLAKAASLLRFLDHTNSETHKQPVWLLWTSDQSVAKVATYKHKRHIHALSSIRTSDLTYKEAEDQRLRTHGHRS
jgi:hypothetical protein